VNSPFSPRAVIGLMREDKIACSPRITGRAKANGRDLPHFAMSNPLVTTAELQLDGRISLDDPLAPRKIYRPTLR
jgi:hypothetical protein